MLELTTQESCTCCSMGRHGWYTTPWCEMLREDGGRFNVLNFWYKLDRMREEIKKRSSYLGKFRRTEEAQHLLDLIAMTEDEEDLFVVFANEAMADVFDRLMVHAPKRGRSYIWDENIPYIKIESNTDVFHVDDIIEYNGKLYIAWMDNVLVPVGIVFDNHEEEPAVSMTALRDKNNDADGEAYPSCFCEPTNNLLFYCASDKPNVGDAVFERIDVNQFEERGPVTSIEMGWDGIELEKKLVETFDWRNSIHYLLAFPKEWNVNMAMPLDTAIFEALVAHIIYKWLQYAYPAEAERFEKERAESLEKVSRRAWLLFGKKTVNRIPRYL